MQSCYVNCCRILFFILGYLIWSVEGTAWLVDPAARSAAWTYGYRSPVNYDFRNLNCGNVKIENVPNETFPCGVCGDPYFEPVPRLTEYDKDNGELFYGNNTPRVRFYTSGSTIGVNTWHTIPGNDRNYFEYRLCKDRDDQTQACFDEHLLAHVNDSSETRFYLPKGIGPFHVDLKLPDGVTCDYCVLQMRFNTVQDESIKCDYTNWCGKGRGKQIHYQNCADVMIGAQGTKKPDDIKDPDYGDTAYGSDYEPDTDRLSSTPSTTPSSTIPTPSTVPTSPPTPKVPPKTPKPGDRLCDGDVCVIDTRDGETGTSGSTGSGSSSDSDSSGSTIIVTNPRQQSNAALLALLLTAFPLLALKRDQAADGPVIGWVPHTQPTAIGQLPSGLGIYPGQNAYGGKKSSAAHGKKSYGDKDYGYDMYEHKVYANGGYGNTIYANNVNNGFHGHSIGTYGHQILSHTSNYIRPLPSIGNNVQNPSAIGNGVLIPFTTGNTVQIPGNSQNSVPETNSFPNAPENTLPSLPPEPVLDVEPGVLINPGWLNSGKDTAVTNNSPFVASSNEGATMETLPTSKQLQVHEIYAQLMGYSDQAEGSVNQIQNIPNALQQPLVSNFNNFQQQKRWAWK